MSYLKTYNKNKTLFIEAIKSPITHIFDMWSPETLNVHTPLADERNPLMKVILYLLPFARLLLDF